MNAKHWLSAAVGGLAMALWAMPAVAAPMSASTTSLKVAAGDSSIVQETHWRGRHRHYYGGYYPYYYNYPSHSYYAPYYYRPPTYGFYYYGRRHHHHHRHYRRW